MLLTMTPTFTSTLKVDEFTYLDRTNSSVVEIPQDRWKDISKIAQNWINFAKANQAAIKTPHYRELGRTDAFDSSIDMCESIAFQIITPPKERPKESDSWNTILICEDICGNPEAIALHDSLTNKLAFLATHPKNIRHEINTDQVHGAATQIILNLATRTLLADSTLRLGAIKGGEDFYTKGFKFLPDIAAQNTVDPTSEVTSMMLPAAKIRELVAQKTPPFNQLS